MKRDISKKQIKTTSRKKQKVSDQKSSSSTGFFEGGEEAIAISKIINPLFPLNDKKLNMLEKMYEELAENKMFTPELIKEQRSKILASSNKEMPNKLKDYVLRKLYFSALSAFTIKVLRQERAAIRGSSLTSLIKADIVIRLLGVARKNDDIPIDIIQDERNAILVTSPYQIRLTGLDHRLSYLQALYQEFNFLNDEDREQECVAIHSSTLWPWHKKSLISYICKGASPEFIKRMETEVDATSTCTIS